METFYAREEQTTWQQAGLAMILPWRMVMDLNTIVNFGKKDGTISKTPQRLLYSLCDGTL